MAKIAIVTDSNSGITQEEAANLGIYVLAMPFIIDGTTFFEDTTLSREQFHRKLSSDADISTSQPAPESVTSLWDELLNNYDYILHIPMSSSLSGSCSSAYGLAQEYDGKVKVVDNKRISITQRQAVLDAIALVKRGKTVEEACEILMNDTYNTSIYVLVDTLKYLKKGGRITAAAAALGTLLRIKPVLTIQGGKIDAFAKARTTKQGKEIMLQALKQDIETRFGGITKRSDMRFRITQYNNMEVALQIKAEIEEMYPQYGAVEIDGLSLSVCTHVGPGTVGVAVIKNLDIDHV